MIAAGGTAVGVLGQFWGGGCACISQPPPRTVGLAQGGRSPAKIAEFRGEYRFLSNFWPAEVWFEGRRYPSAEHAYQAAKSLDDADRARIAALYTASEAKTAGRALKLRPDWDTAKFEVMEACVRDKFTRNAELRAKLLATADAYLEEGNDWGDRVWGVSGGVGENRLGLILMKVRDEIRAAR